MTRDKMLNRNLLIGCLGRRLWQTNFIVGLLATASIVIAPAAMLEQTDVFVSGTDGYHTLRIPAIVISSSGTVLAFAEGRKNSASDTSDIAQSCRSVPGRRPHPA